MARRILIAIALRLGRRLGGGRPDHAGDCDAHRSERAVTVGLRHARIFLWAALAAASLLPAAAAGQDASPSLRAGALPAGITIDGRLDEEAWSSADPIDAFAQTEPAEGAAPTGRTTVRVLADRRALVIGIVCEYPEELGIVSFSVRRD